MTPARLWLVACLASMLAGPSPAATETLSRTAVSRTVLILDASGSMWGQLEGRSKISIAREVVGELLDGWSAEHALGLTAYGHRRRADCSDIQSLVSLASDNAPALLAAVQRITPKGKTPIGAALQHAAEELGARRVPATVILVSDGKETCDADPCAVAAALERESTDFTAHVIGFDVTPEEREGLACIASETGGSFVAANGAAELREAVGEAMSRARAVRTPGLWLGAALASTGAVVTTPVSWSIYRTARAGSPEDLVHLAQAPTVFLALPGGRYRVVAELHGVRGQSIVEVDENRSQRKVVGLGAGRLMVTATLGRYDAPLEGPVAFEVRDGERLVATSSGAKDEFLLPAGRYRVTAEHDGVRQTREADLAAGREVRQRFRFGSGQLSLRAVLGSGSNALDDPLSWEIRRAPEDRRVEREPIVSQETATLLLTLGAGRYEVTVRYGDAVTRRLVDLLPGTIRTHTLDLDAGTARVFASLPPPGGPIQERVHWKIYRIGENGARALFTERHDASHAFVLPAGRYRVEGRVTGRSGAREVEVEPGGSSALGVVLR